jgi:hypothetical protein
MKQAPPLEGCQASDRRGTKPDGKREQHENAKRVNRDFYWISHRILRPAVLPSHGVQILPAQRAVN